MTSALDAIGAGAALALSFNPVLAAGGAALAAALFVKAARSARRKAWALFALAASWIVGDGFRVIGTARELFDGVSPAAPAMPAWVDWTAIASWAAGGLAIGYVVPFVLGLFVGRRVTHGTGWLAAIAVAVGASLAISRLGGQAVALGC